MHLSSPQMWFTCKTGTTRAASRILAITTASTIWFLCWFNPPETTTTKNLLLSFEILTEAFRYLRLKSKQGRYPWLSGCFQNSFSSSEKFLTTPRAGKGTICSCWTEPEPDDAADKTEAKNRREEKEEEDEVSGQESEFWKNVENVIKKMAKEMRVMRREMRQKERNGDAWVILEFFLGE